MDDKDWQAVRYDILHEREMREQWQQAHERFHALDKDAVILARRDIDRRLEEMNNFREQIARERGEFLRRDIYDEQHSVLRNETDTRLKNLENVKSNLEGRMWAVGAGFMVLTIGINLLLRFLVK